MSYARHASSEGWTCGHPVVEAAREAGVHRQTVWNALNAAQEAGEIKLHDGSSVVQFLAFAASSCPQTEHTRVTECYVEPETEHTRVTEIASRVTESYAEPEARLIPTNPLTRITNETNGNRSSRPVTNGHSPEDTDKPLLPVQPARFVPNDETSPRTPEELAFARAAVAEAREKYPWLRRPPIDQAGSSEEPP